MFEKTDENARKAIEIISHFQANLGGNEILQPLQFAIDQISYNAHQTRIFLMTDADLSAPETVIYNSNTQQAKIRIHTFGIGDSCNKSILEQVAQNIRGSCS